MGQWAIALRKKQWQRRSACTALGLKSRNHTAQVHFGVTPGPMFAHEPAVQLWHHEHSDACLVYTLLADGAGISGYLRNASPASHVSQERVELGQLRFNEGEYLPCCSPRPVNGRVRPPAAETVSRARHRRCPKRGALIEALKVSGCGPFLPTGAEGLSCGGGH